MIPVQQSRSQASQQSFSQGASSQQNAMFSLISQNSLDELLADNQRFGSQEKDNSAKRVPCLAPMSYPREESQLPISRSSANLPRRWSSAVPELKCQLNDELERKVTSMETSLSRLGMIVDSIQSDIMQVNKGTRELSLAVEGIRQKSIAHDDSFHLLNQGQEELKTSLYASFRSISNQLNTITQQEKMQEFMSSIMTLPDQIQANVHKQTEELSRLLSGDLQAIICILNTLNQKHFPLAILSPKVTGGDSSLQKPLLRREPEPVKNFKQGRLGPEIESGGWTTVKAEQCALSNQYGNSFRNLKQRRICPQPMLDREDGKLQAIPLKVFISLDDESDEDFSCFMDHKELDNHLVAEVNQEAERILRKARRRKRKQTCKR